MTLGPGAYVGGIEVSSNSNVTLLPGVHVFQGGALKVYDS